MSAADYERFGGQFGGGYPLPTSTNPLQTATTDVAAGLGVWEGVQKGGLYGDAAAAVSGVRLGASLGLPITKGAQGLAGDAGNVLGIVGGIEQGGITGYSAAGINAAELGSKVGAFGGASGEVGQLAGEAVIPLSVYQFGKNWRSGATGADAISGAESGAAIGSVVPGIGTLLGAGVGAVVGAVSSLFGPGRRDPETVGWDQYAKAYQQHGAQGVAGASPSQNFQMLAGIFDARGSSIPFYGKFGRMGENQFMDAMAQKINQAASAGAILNTDSPQQIYAKVVEPWINSMSPGGWKDSSTIQGVPEKAAVGNLLTGLIGDYTSGQLTSGTPVGIQGQTIGNLPQYRGPMIASGGAQGNFPINPSQQAVNSAGQTSMLPTLLAAGGATALTSAPGASMAKGQFQLNDPTGMNTIGANGPIPPDGGPIPQDGSSGSGVDPLATAGILSGIGLLGAGYAQNQNNKVISPITGVGAPYVGAGQTLLGRSMNNQLTPQQSQVVSTAQSQGSSLIAAATPVGQIAQGLFQQYQSGNLKPGDQAQLDQQITAAKAQIAQSLGPNVDGTTLQTYYDQIDQQALITKNNLLNSYFQTGNQAFDTWSSTTQAGQAAILAGQEYAVTSIDNTFEQALSAGALGGTDIMAGINATLQSNSQLAQSFGNYMSNLAKAFALAKYSTSGASSGGAGAGAPAGGPTGTDMVGAGVSSDVNSEFNTAMADQMGAYTSGYTPSSPASGSVTVGQPGASDVMSNISSSFSENVESGMPSYSAYAGYGM